jgi:hypothetical protein
LNTSEILKTEAYFKVTSKGGVELEVGPVPLEVIDPFLEPPSTALDQCTH